MRKSTLRALAASLLLTSAAWTQAAEMVTENYFEDFENCSSDQPIPLGWYHLIDTSGDDTVSYYWASYGGHMPEGREGRACMRVGEQSWQENYWSEYTYPLDDFVIPPRVKGDVSFFAKKYGIVAELKVYQFTRDSEGNYIQGELLDPEGALASNTSDWAEFKLHFDDFTYIGLKIDNCYFDSFSASQAIEDEIPAMKLSQFSLYDKDTFYSDADGNTTVLASIKIENTGNCDLEPGNPKFSLTIRSGSSVSSPELAVVPLDTVLAVGATRVYRIEIPYTLEDPTVHKSVTMCAFENATNTSSYSIYPKIRAYIPELEIYDSATTTGGQLGAYKLTDLSLGLFSGVKEASVTLVSMGGAPLVVSALDLPEGVTCVTELPVTLEAGDRVPLNLHFSSTVEGPVSGVVGLTTNASADNASSRNSFNYFGAMANEGTFMENFEAGGSSIPGGWTVTGDKWSFYTSSGMNANSYAQCNDYSENATLATPLIEFAEGGKINFALARTSSYGEVYAKVYTSPDRVNWTEVGEISKENNDQFASASIYDYTYFSMDVPAGQHYVGFRGRSIYLDNVFGGQRAEVTDDLFMTGYKLAQEGTVNSPMEFSVSLRNLASADVEDYTVALMDGETPLKQAADLPVLSATESTPVTIAFSYTPHEAREMNLCVKVELPSGYSIATPVRNLTVKPETFSSDVMVGTVTASETSNSNQVPLAFYDKNSIAELIYPATDINAGAGAKVVSVTFPFHFSSSSSSEAIKDIKIWMENTAAADVEMRTGDVILNDTVNMVKVYDGQRTFASGCEGELIYNGKFGTMTFTFPEEFIYSGENLRLIVHSRMANDKYISGTGFATYSGTTGQFAAADQLDRYLTKETSRISSIPVMILGVNAQAPVLSGIVTREGTGTPKGGAKVTFNSGDVMYTATSADDGTFAVEILKPLLTYTGKVAASSYVDYTFDPAMYEEATDLGTVALAPNVIDGTSLMATVDGTAEGTIAVVWDPIVPGSEDESVEYTVTLDGTPVASGLTDCEYTLTEVPEGDHTIGVFATFLPSDLDSDVVTTSATLTGIDGVTVEGESLVLNGRTVIVNATEAGTVRVFNTAGQAVRTLNVSAGTHTFTLAPGTYVVTLGKTVRKAIVK